MKILRIAAEHTQNILVKEEEKLKELTLKELQLDDPDFLLINEEIKAWEKVTIHSKDDDQDQIDKYLFSLMIEIVKNFGTNNPEWISAAEQFMNTLFVVKQLKAYKKAELFLHSLIKRFSSDQDNIIEKIEKDIMDHEEIEIDDTFIDGNLDVNQAMLAQLIFAAGHLAVKMIVYIENVTRILEKRNEKKKNNLQNPESNEDNELLLIAGGSDADLEADKTFLHNITEKTLLQKNLLAKFVPVVETIVKNIHTKYEKATKHTPASFLERVSVLSFCKFMIVSQIYCSENIQLLFSLLELEKFDSKSKSNILICIGDLFKCHPTILDKKSKDFFANLSNKSAYVRRHCLRVISHLALNDMIKVKGEISDIIKLLKDEDPKIREIVKLFLHELHSKDKETIYGLIPEAINRLSEYTHFESKDFEEIAQILVKYVEKDKQIEQLLEKLCSKLCNSTTNSEIRNTAYTISILNLTDKHLPKLMDKYDKYKAQIQKDDYVRE